jgi:hypothetical protein
VVAVSLPLPTANIGKLAVINVVHEQAHKGV